jgi:undecaprenyl-diphosphatase
MLVTTRTRTGRQRSRGGGHAGFDRVAHGPGRRWCKNLARQPIRTGADLDFTVYKAINGFAYGHDSFEDVLRFFALDAQYFFVALLAGLFFARGKWSSVNARHGVIAAGLAAALALAIAHGITLVWPRPRPYVAHPEDAHLFISPSGDPSFPSDHATAAFAIAVSLLLRSRRIGLLALVMAAILAVARVAVGTHYPSDVVGGAALGTAAALFLWLPPIRGRLHRVADWMGAVYERTAIWALRLPSRHPG